MGTRNLISRGVGGSLELIRPIEWNDDGSVRILDQTKLPGEETYVLCRQLSDVEDAIRRLAVRGAPALGIAAAFGMALAAHASRAGTAGEVREELQGAGDRLISTRPTAVNIGWAVARALGVASRCSDVAAARAALVKEAEAVAREDEEACRQIGGFGASLVPPDAGILTHCNTGMLCTGGIGTAQGVIFTAHREGKRVHVWVDETRPLLQGARLTAWELQRLGVPMTLVTDGAAAALFARGLIDLVLVGADRVAANGDVANKIGTYGLAVLAAHHGVPFYVAAPTSSVDIGIADGGRIPIEERDAGEVTAPLGSPAAPEGTPALNPAFDVTPAALVTAIVTERGIVRGRYEERLRRLLGDGRGAR